MAKKKWMKTAVEHPGALRETAMRLGIIQKDNTIGPSEMAKLAAHAKKTGDTTLMRRVNLARTFAKHRPGS